MEKKSSLTALERQLLEKEMRGSFDFIWNESNPIDGPGYGLTRDTTREKKASIAAVGFALAGYVVGVERHYITLTQGYERSLKTLKTLFKLDHYNGFIVHFADPQTGQPYRSKQGHRTEYSTIDTALAAMGALVAGAYFQGDVQILAMQLVERINWESAVIREGPKVYLRMAIDEHQQWSTARWDHYAEQLMMYFLYAGQPQAKVQLTRDLYFDFMRPLGSYKGQNFVYCYGNPLFIHQFSHIFIPFQDYVDVKGFDWFQNSVDATLANRSYCIDQATWSKTLHANAWGLTASHTAKGYGVFGSLPMFFNQFDEKNEVDGTIPPYGALCSLPFTPRESLDCLLYWNQQFPQLWGPYGLYDAYNLDLPKPWFATDYLGIDKGPTLLMIDNFLYGTTWTNLMKQPSMKKAFEVLKFSARR